MKCRNRDDRGKSGLDSPLRRCAGRRGNPRAEALRLQPEQDAAVSVRGHSAAGVQTTNRESGPRFAAPGAARPFLVRFMSQGRDDIMMPKYET